MAKCVAVLKGQLKRADEAAAARGKQDAVAERNGADGGNLSVWGLPPVKVICHPSCLEDVGC